VAAKGRAADRAAGEDTPPIALVTLESRGVALIYGRDEAAIEVVADSQSVSTSRWLLTKPGDVPLATQTSFQS